MDNISTEISENTKVDKSSENHQDYIENDASDYESINSGNEDNYSNEHNSDYESDTVENTERQEGDGEESIPPKKVDDDEDKKNPQYIPKRGTFYEHDDRTLEEQEEEAGTDKKERQSKKSIWIEKKERWGHDRFNENEQAPKSRTELIGIYGYDIRNEEGPPRARRRRRYGRGPNKYTRTWEDEDAYKPAKPVKTPPKKSNGIEEYPPLEAELKQEKNKQDNKNHSIEIKKSTPVEKENIRNAVSKPMEIESKIEKVIPKITENVPAVVIQQKEVQPADYRGFTKVRQYKNSQIEQKIVKKQERVQVENLENDVAKLSITRKQNRQNSVPPRLQNEQKGPKRYSSLRQRSLPESVVASNTFNQQPFYANDYTPPQPQQAILSQPSQATVLQPIPQTIQQVPVTATALLPTPTQFAPAFQAPPGFIPATVQPSPFIPPQPQIINYVASQPQFAQPPFQGFPHQQFNTVTPTAELNYQCQGGTTYYSTQNQQLGHIPLLPRPKAAIPILPPPPQEPHNAGSLNTDTDDNKEYNDFYSDDYEDTNIIVQ